MNPVMKILFINICLWTYTFTTVTGAIVSYHLVYSRAIQNLDGFNKSIILTNGKFPGPSLRAKVGDTISVVVSNFLMEMDALSVHWHGIDQLGTPWSVINPIIIG